MFSPFIQLHRLETWLDWRRGKHQSLCHAICTLYKYVCKALDYRGQYMFWCYALLCFRYITNGYGCHSLHWVALEIQWVWCAMLWSHCSVDNAPILEKFPSDKVLQTMMSQMLSLLPDSLDSIIVQFSLCSIFAILFAAVYRVFCKIHCWIWYSLNMIVKLRLFRWSDPLSYLIHKYVA